MMKFAAAAAVAALASGAGMANAQAMIGGPYVKGFGGFSFPLSDNTSFNEVGTNINQDYSLDYKTGYTLGVAAGYAVSNSLALELEYAYRNADSDSSIGGHTSSNAIMGNAIYRFNPIGATGQIVPYAGGGIGIANVDLATDDLGDFKSTGNFAYQAMAGIGYAVTPNITLMGEARYFSTKSSEVKHQGLQGDISFSTVDLLFGASYSF